LLPKELIFALKAFGNSKNEMARSTKELTSITLLQAARELWLTVSDQ
jgi:hypothetical protein